MTTMMSGRGRSLNRTSVGLKRALAPGGFGRPNGGPQSNQRGIETHAGEHQVQGRVTEPQSNQRGIETFYLLLFVFL